MATGSITFNQNTATLANVSQMLLAKQLESLTIDEQKLIESMELEAVTALGDIIGQIEAVTCSISANPSSEHPLAEPADALACLNTIGTSLNNVKAALDMVETLKSHKAMLARST